MGIVIWGMKVTFSLTSGGLRDWTFTQAFARDISDDNSYPSSCLQTSQVPLGLPYHSALQLGVSCPPPCISLPVPFKGTKDLTASLQILRRLQPCLSVASNNIPKGAWFPLLFLFCSIRLSRFKPNTLELLPNACAQ